MSQNLGASNATDHRGKKYLDIDSNVWSSIHATVRENQDYFDNDKNNHINAMIYKDYTTNADIIPIIPLPITGYMTTIKANAYNKSNNIELKNGSDEVLKYLKFNNLKLALTDMLISYELNGVGIIRVKGGTPLTLESVSPEDVVYNYKFTKVVIKLDVINESTFRYEYYKKLSDNKWQRIQFTAGDFYTISYDKIGEDSVTTVESKENLAIMPIVPLFKNAKKVAFKSVFVYADLILNILLGFGLANVPQAVLVKLWIENAKNAGSIAMADKLSALSDILDVVPLGQTEKIGRVDTGDLTAFINFFSVFEALLTHIAQMEGIPRSAMQIASPARESGTAKQTDNRSANIFRDNFLMRLNDYEDRLFETISKVLGKDWDIKNIDKNTSITMSSSEILEEGILAVTNGFEDFVVAISKYQGLSKEDARKKLDDIMKSREKYGELLVGMAGQPMADGGAVGNNKKEEGVYKKDTKNSEKKSNE